MDGCRVSSSHIQAAQFLVELALITGLPAALPTLPLELTVLYNSLLFVLGTSDRVIEGEAEGIRQGLLRGKENNLCFGDVPQLARGGGTVNEEGWICQEWRRWSCSWGGVMHSCVAFSLLWKGRKL